MLNWLLALLQWVWDWLRGWPRQPTITSIWAEPAVVAPGGVSIVTVRVRGGRPPYRYVAETTRGRVQQVGDGVFEWRDE
jgi:hypothetical protein